jgi:thiamine-monophosphate kinase
MALTEGSLVAWLASRAARGPEVIVGIGHDAAVVRSPAGDALVLKSDQTIEEVHFLRGEQPWEQVGRKALARVLSDVGAVGGRPVAALCSLALPADVAEAEVRALFEGLLALAQQHGVSLVGGDLSRSPRGVAIDVAGLGFMDGRTPLRRDGARAGDLLVVSGPLGASRARHHHAFEPRWKLGVALAASGAVTSCIDLSDGLARDLEHVAAASRVGARVELAKLPLRPLDGGAHATVAQALHDGEDYELLFTVAPDRWRTLAATPELAALPHALLGTITAARDGVVTVDGDGRVEPLPSGGFEHRFGTPAP